MSERARFWTVAIGTIVITGFIVYWVHQFAGWTFDNIGWWAPFLLAALVIIWDTRRRYRNH